MNEFKAVVIRSDSAHFGAELALHLTECGYRVCMLGGNAVPGAAHVPLELADIAGLCQAMQRANEQLGRIDALINAVRIGAGEGEVTREAYKSVMDTNVKAALFACKAAVPYLKRQGGHILNLTGAYFAADPLLSASQAALTALTRELAVDLGRYFIRCNTLAFYDGPQENTLLGLPTAADACELTEFLLSSGAYPIVGFDFPAYAGAGTFIK